MAELSEFTHCSDKSEHNFFLSVSMYPTFWRPFESYLLNLYELIICSLTSKLLPALTIQHVAKKTDVKNADTEN